MVVNHMKRKFQIIGSSFITICLLAISLKYLTDLMELKDSDSKYMPFFMQDENFDVLFIGNSHVINGIYPMELWHDYGIISYNMGGHSNQPATSYWVMENALEQTSPRLIVIDCMDLGVAVKSSSLFSYGHLSFDVFPLNLTKISAVQDLTDDPQPENTSEMRSGIELLWNYPIYHTRWNELTQIDFNKSYTLEKGAEFRVGVAIPDTINKIPADRKLKEETIGTEYLSKIIEDCQRRDIEVLLIYLPFPASESQQMEANRVYDIAAEYGVNYLNFLDMDIVDYNTDCYDTNSHLNPSGGYKVTDYIGRYIIDNYDILDQRANSAYDSWYGDYDRYSAYKVNLLKNQESLDQYLILLTDRNYDVEIEINNPAIWKNEYYVRLLNNLGADAETVTEYSYKDENSYNGAIPDVHIVVTDSETEDVIDEADFNL